MSARVTAVRVLAALLLAASIACAQQIPDGTALPLWLNSNLDVNKVRSGEVISAAIAQSVPLPSKAKIAGGAQVTGRVLQAGRKSDGSSYIRLTFDRVHVDGRDLSIRTRLRAIASPWEVQEAQLPKHPTFVGESSTSTPTVQIGGDDVYGSGGAVMHGDMVVGEAVSDGVLARLYPVPGSGCETGSAGQELALWVFSSHVCGAYGLRFLQAANDDGTIVLMSKKKVRVPVGSGLLLIVEAPPSSQVRKP